MIRCAWLAWWRVFVWMALLATLEWAVLQLAGVRPWWAYVASGCLIGMGRWVGPRE